MGKVAIASRVAAKLRERDDVQVDVVNGGLGELRVVLDGQNVYKSSRFWYPRPGKIIRAVTSRLKSSQRDAVT